MTAEDIIAVKRQLARALRFPRGWSATESEAAIAGFARILQELETVTQMRTAAVEERDYLQAALKDQQAELERLRTELRDARKSIDDAQRIGVQLGREHEAAERVESEET